MNTRLIAALLIATASTAAAQVGYDPGKSPYRDLDRGQEITITTGQFRASLDPARVAPHSGAWVGLKYQWLVGGPANVTAEIARVGSERRVLDPLLPATCTGVSAEDCKLIRTFRWPLYFADLGMALNLTGPRSSSLVPEVGRDWVFSPTFTPRQTSVISRWERASCFRTEPGFGTSHRAVINSGADFGDRLYSVKYPESYFTKAPDGSYIRQPRDKRSAWLHNGMLTLGVSYLFGSTP